MTLQQIAARVKEAFTPADLIVGEANQLLEDYEKETGGQAWRTGIKPDDFPTGKRLLNAASELQFAVLHTILSDKNTGYSGARAAILVQLLRRDLPYTTEALEQILSDALHKGEYYGHWSMMLKVAERFAAKEDLTPTLRDALQRMHDECHGYGVEGRRFKARLAELLGVSPRPDTGTAWADTARGDVEAMEPDVRAAWDALFQHAATADGSKPTAKWVAEADNNRRAVGEDEFAARVSGWLRLASPPGPLHSDQARLPGCQRLVTPVPHKPRLHRISAGV